MQTLAPSSEEANLLAMSNKKVKIGEDGSMAHADTIEQEIVDREDSGRRKISYKEMVMGEVSSPQET